MSAEDNNQEVKRDEINTFHLVPCPECDKYLDYTIDVKCNQNYSMIIEGDPDSRMKQAAITSATEHNKTGHNAFSYKLKLVGNSEAEKVELFKEIMSWYSRLGR